MLKHPVCPTAISKVALVSVVSPKGETGGVERLYQGLTKSLEDYGISVKLISVPVSDTSFASVLDAYLRFYDLDLSEYDAVVSTKAPSHVVRHRNHVCYLPHTIRTFYDMDNFVEKNRQFEYQRRIIQLLDYAAFNRRSLKALYCVGKEVQQRLKEYLKVESKVLHHPSTLLTRTPREGQYLFLPGRLHKWKRVDMVIRSLQQTKTSIPLLISGVGEEEKKLKILAKELPNIHFVGYQNDEQLSELYAGALAVIFCPIREDYGLVTIEAFASHKPVITCRDSGEPARLVSDGYNGLICDPSETQLAKIFDWLVTHPIAAKTMGENGFNSLEDISWAKVCGHLMAAVGIDTEVSRA